MRARITICLLLVSAVAVAQDRALIGKWESVTRSTGGIGSTLQLSADGSLARTVGAMVDATYTFDGRTLVTTIVDPAIGKKDTTKYRVRIAGDQLTEINGGGRGVDIVMTRQTPMDITLPLAGTWRYAHSSGATAFLTFTADGRELLRIPMRVDGGSWVAVGDQLTLNVAGNDPVTSRYRVDRDVLTLVDNGKEFQYRRAHD